MGTAFAFCEESGLRSDYKRAILEKVAHSASMLATDPSASPTSFPFKVAQLEGTLSETEIYLARPRVCDLGYLRETYRTHEGKIGYRCSAEPLTVYVSKGESPKTRRENGAFVTRCWQRSAIPRYETEI